MILHAYLLNIYVYIYMYIAKTLHIIKEFSYLIYLSIFTNIVISWY